MTKKICGPKLSLCCSIISIWGIVQLVLMGTFFYSNSVALSEDLGVEGKFESKKAYLQEVDAAYAANAYKCWMAVVLYVVSLVFCAWQLYINKKASLQ